MTLPSISPSVFKRWLSFLMNSIFPWSSTIDQKAPERNDMDSLSSHTQTVCTDLNGLTAEDFFLKNPDLVTQILSHLPFENDKKYRLCLFNAALTCKDFLDAALDALWEKLDSLVPLLKLLPALRVENQAYVCPNALHFFLCNMTLILSFRSSVGLCLRRIGIDWNIIREESRFSKSCHPIPNVLRSFLPPIFVSLSFSHLFSSHPFVTFAARWRPGPHLTSSFSSRHPLNHLNLPISRAPKIILFDHFWMLFPLRCSIGSSFALGACQWTL